MAIHGEKPESDLPNSRGSDPKEIIKKMLDDGLVTPDELAELFATRKSIGTSAVHMLEQQKEKLVSFSDAAKQLKTVGLDLEKARRQAVHRHKSLGLVSTLKKKGIIQNADQYGALFDTVTFTQKGLAALTEKTKTGSMQLPVFNPGHLSLEELWKVLIVEGRIPFWEYSYGFQHISQLRKIDPKDIPGLPTLHEKSYKAQLQAFAEAYKTAPLLMPGLPSVIFTTNTNLYELPDINVDKSATKHNQAALEGAQFIDPMSDLIKRMEIRSYFYREPNFATQYPLYVFENGGIAYLYWDSNSRKLDLDYCRPGRADSRLGSRSVLQ